MRFVPQMMQTSISERDMLDASSRQNDQELTAMLYIDSIFPAGVNVGWSF